MKTYILTVVSAAVLSSLAYMMTPENWKKYVQIVTGIVIISCIMMPLSNLISENISFEIPSVTANEYNEDLNRELIIDELSLKIENDIKNRISSEFGIDITAAVDIDINDDNEINGVRKITIKSGKLTRTAEKRLCEVYGVDGIDYE